MKVNYAQEVPMTHEEKVTMYMGIRKKELIEMLIESNRLLAFLTEHPKVYQIEDRSHLIKFKDDEEEAKGEAIKLKLQDLVDNTKDVDPDILDFVNDNFWDLF